MTEENLFQILQYGTFAPSGDNCQPWFVRVGKDEAIIYVDKEKDKSLYNYDQIASYLAVGAFVENVSIAALQLGFQTNISLFPQGEDLDAIAKISFLPSQQKNHPLFESIEKRSTNRKPYKQSKLSSEELRLIKEAAAGNLELRLTEDDGQVSELADAASKNELVVLNNRNLHTFLFEHVVWSQNQMEKERKGMFIQTLEMNTFQKKIFGLCSNWSVLRFLDKFKLSQKIASENRAIYAQSSAFGVLTLKILSPEHLVKAGQTMQRVWLTATSLGLSLHPLTGIIFLKNRINHTQSADLSQHEINIVNEAYRSIEKVFGLDAQTVPIFMFRLGKAEAPSAVSIKKDIKEILK